MKKEYIKFKMPSGDIILRRGKILAIRQEKEGSDWWDLAYKFTERYVHHYMVLLLPDACESKFLIDIGLINKEPKKKVNAPTNLNQKTSYYGGNTQR